MKQRSFGNRQLASLDDLVRNHRSRILPRSPRIIMHRMKYVVYQRTISLHLVLIIYDVGGADTHVIATRRATDI